MPLIDLQYLEERKGKGVCIGCGVKLPGTEYAAPRCADCNHLDQIKYHERLAVNCCTRCNDPALQGFRHCKYHRDQDLEYRQRIKERELGHGHVVSTSEISSVMRQVRDPRPARQSTSGWSYERVLAAYEAIVGESRTLTAELNEMAAGEDAEALKELVSEVHAECRAKLAALFTESGWTRDRLTEARYSRDRQQAAA